MDLNRATELIEEFIADPRFSQAVVYNQLRQVFDVIDPGETGLSKVIAWLLNPREGHGLGDYFIKALLRNTVLNGSECCPLSLLDVEQLALTNLNVKFEHSFKQKGKSRRIDILATDLTSKLMVVIEHKFGTKEHDDQLSDYSRWAEVLLESNPDFRLVLILMDGNEAVTGDDLRPREREKWAIVSHQWLIDALAKIIDSDSIQASSRWILKDLYIHLTHKYELDESFKPACSFIASMASRYSTLIEGLGAIQLHDKDNETVSLYGWDDTDFLAWRQLLRPEQLDQVLKLHQFLIKNETLLASLRRYHRLQWIEESLEQSHPGKYVFFSGGSYLGIYSSDWERYESEDHEYYPFYLQVEDKQLDGESVKSLRVYVRKNAFEDQNLANALANSFGKRLGDTQNRRVKLMEVKITSESYSDEKLMSEIRDILKRIQSVLLKIR